MGKVGQEWPTSSVEQGGILLGIQPAVRGQVGADLGREVGFFVQCRHVLPDWRISVFFVFIEGIALCQAPEKSSAPEPFLQELAC
jgi:hypothetical protein